MSEQEVYSKIQEIYKTEKGKNFITHLVRSFYPTNRSNFVTFHEELGEERKLLCCITGKELFIKVDLASKAIANEGFFIEKMQIGVKQALNEEATPSKELLQHEAEIEKMKNFIAVMCEKSNKLMSHIAFQQLANFFSTELLRGNKHIQWVLKDERSKEFVQHGKTKGWIKNTEDERVITKAATNMGGKSSKMTLGELGVLQQLKERMKNEESSAGVATL
jgi:hypothetical protein